jgi:hypothetical protein
VLNSRSERSGDMWPLDLTTEIHFGSLGFGPFSSTCTCNPSNCEISSTCPLVLDDRDLLQEFRLRGPSRTCSCNSPKWGIPEVRDLVTCGLSLQWIMIYFGTSGRLAGNLPKQAFFWLMWKHLVKFGTSGL